MYSINKLDITIHYKPKPMFQCNPYNQPYITVIYCNHQILIRKSHKVTNSKNEIYTPMIVNTFHKLTL